MDIVCELMLQLSLAILHFNFYVGYFMTSRLYLLIMVLWVICLEFVKQNNFEKFIDDRDIYEIY